MGKYSYEIKKGIVEEYIEGKGGYKYLSNKYGVKTHLDIEKWVFAYSELGNEYLMRSRQNKEYSFEFKLFAVKLYLTTEVTYQELALSVRINNPSLKNTVLLTLKKLSKKVLTIHIQTKAGHIK